MTAFQRMSNDPPKCDICGGSMRPVYGEGWDNDRIECKGFDCGAEIVFPTSTPPSETNQKEQIK